MNSFDAVDRLTIPEYELLIEAHRLKEVDRDALIHWQAYLNFAAQATNKSGKPVYKKFEKFYNYKKELKKAGKESYKVKGDSPFDGIGEIMRKGGCNG